jgi:polysaccharide deacetylase family protein (PEP-CTERM system associated)
VYYLADDSTYSDGVYRTIVPFVALGLQRSSGDSEQHMKHVLTFDVEEYFHVTAFADKVSPADWSTLDSRLEPSIELTLNLLQERGSKATFFTLGWVAERYPSLVRRIADAGHEIACHSNRHQQVFRLTPQEFREDSLRAKDLLEHAGGVRVQGYRAPSFSIIHESVWALEVLAEAGFSYDSSIFPVRHPNYGMVAAPRTPFVVNTPSGPLVEFPMPALSIGGRRAPFGGGAYLRLLPYWYTRWAIQQFGRETGHGACVYAHPWEFDPHQPRMKGRLTSRLRHYIGLRGVERKLRRLLTDFEFTTFASMVSALIESSDEKRSIASVAAG